VLPSNFCQAINLKQVRGTNYILPFLSDTHTYEHLLLVPHTWFIQMRHGGSAVAVVSRR